MQLPGFAVKLNVKSIITSIPLCTGVLLAPTVTEICRLLWNSKFRYRIQYCPLVDPVFSQFNLLKPNDIYRVSQEERAKLRESVPYVKLYRYNPKHLYPKLNGYGDNGQRKVWTSCISAFCTQTAVS